MRTHARLRFRTALHGPWSAFMRGAGCAQCRGFFDVPIADEAVASDLTRPDASSPGSTVEDNPTPSHAGSSYTHPLDVGKASFRLYGESSKYAADDPSRIFFSVSVHSYNPAILFSDLRLQGAHHKSFSLTNDLGAGGAGDTPLPAGGPAAESQMSEYEESDAVMRSGRNKQGAAGAAAMAAAMYDSRRAADGIAMVPGHPLPVVFPRPDGPPPHFKKPTLGGGVHKAGAGTRAYQTMYGSEEDAESIVCAEVMESQRCTESYSLQHSIVWRVQVLDEHRKPTPIKPFHHFREALDVLPVRVMQGLSELGFTHPTLLQSAAIRPLVCGRDVVGVAPGGSGRTVAYIVPSIAVLVKAKAAEEQDRLEKVKVEGVDSASVSSELGAAQPSSSGDAVAHPIVVVLCTTRHAVLRTAAMYSSLAGEGVRLVAAYRLTDGGDEDDHRCVIRWKRGCDVMVATPACLMLLVREGHVVLDRVHVLAVDTASHFLAADCAQDDHSAVQHVEDIMHAVKENGVTHQFSLWCAEMRPSIEALVRKYMSPLTLTVMVTREEHTSANVRQILYPLPRRDDRIKAILQLYDQRIILKRHQVVVYCACRETAEEVTRELIKGLSAPLSMVRCVHSGLHSHKRNKVLKAFQSGRIRILVATDVATKQLDAGELEHVIHYDLPAFTEVYMQRVNLVGRSGRQGTSHAFLTPGDACVPKIAKFVEEETGHALSDDIRRMIADIEAEGGGNSWDTAVLRARHNVASNTKWRVRGQWDIRQPVESISDVAPELGKKPMGAAR
ncbi:hypothetical protein GH5_06883 [Leishmania sp. Ghana 2012 LV757]|uniref:hypothetical protein n=1 Tax=Leishmania sp. Ghana 2012 LV757 TaxID=2803181 RepID=UPI001B63F52A|nr:hypothetical protein GH5_06883 [Leishmania sp. Ghana 2012 LV757]